MSHTFWHLLESQEHDDEPHCGLCGCGLDGGDVVPVEVYDGEFEVRCRQCAVWTPCAAELRALEAANAEDSDLPEGW